MNIEDLWFGSEASLEPYLRYLAYMENSPPAQLRSGFGEEDDEDEDEVPALVQIEDSVGIININGSLIPQSNFFTRLFGMTGYDEISAAAQYLNDDDDVERIALSINSGGGSAMGVEAAGEILKIVAKNKPMYSNSEGGMLSAAYWLGAIGKEVSGTAMASFGSVGTVISHTSVNRALKERGVDVTVIRSGKYKALGHPAEPLSKEAKAKLQKDADKMTGFFREHVEAQRKSKLSDWSQWGEGRSLFAEDAIGVGLADRVSNLSQLVTRLNSKTTTHSPEETPNMAKKTILHDDQAAAQLESGVPLKDVNHTEASLEDSTAGEISSAGVELASSGKPAGNETNTPTVQAAETPAAKKVDTSEVGLVAYLKEENTRLQHDLSEVQAELTTVKADLAEVNTHQPALVAAVATAVQKMQVGMGQAPVAGLEKLPAGTVMEQYDTVRAQFHQAFPVGQQSADTPTKESTRAPVTPLSLGIMPKAV